MLSKVLPLVLLLVLFAGCTQQVGQAPSQQQTQPPTTPGTHIQTPPPSQPVQPPEAGWDTYRNIGITFQYPAGMKVTESLSSYPGYATIAIQGGAQNNDVIIIAFVNLTGTDYGNPLDAAENTLTSDSNAIKDPLGLLHQATQKGDISKYESANGLATAERTFSIAKGNITLYGYALELYDDANKAAYGVRILSINQSQSQEMKNTFISTFK
jgi:hypothetical protein